MAHWWVSRGPPEAPAPPYGPTLALQRSIFALDLEMTLDYSQVTSVYGGPIMCFDRDHTEDPRDCTSNELSQPGFIGDTMKLVAMYTDESKDTRCTYNNTKGYFTVAEVFEAIVKFERINRPKTADCHHIFFEGLGRSIFDKEAFAISWGS
ncbi:Activating signal cointegrator 1 complex subunit [Pycnococcus provasolii]